MSVKKINAEDLRRMKDKEGLILQGCGGSIDEWVDGINDLLTGSEILLGGIKFKAENCCGFENEDLTCLLLPFSEDVRLDMGRLAMWRLQTHENFGGEWLSDYVNNKLGGFLSEETAERKKPYCKLIGEDGKQNWEIDHPQTYRQLSLFDDFNFQSDVTVEDSSKTLFGQM